MKYIPLQMNLLNLLHSKHLFFPSYKLTTSPCAFQYFPRKGNNFCKNSNTCNFKTIESSCLKFLNLFIFYYCLSLYKIDTVRMGPSGMLNLLVKRHNLTKNYCIFKIRLRFCYLFFVQNFNDNIFESIFNLKWNLN